MRRGVDRRPSESRSTGRMAPASEPAVVANRKTVRRTVLYGCVKSNDFRSTDPHVCADPHVITPLVLLPTSGSSSDFRLLSGLPVARKGGVRTGKCVRASELRDGQPLRVRTGHAPSCGRLSRGTRLSRHCPAPPGANGPIRMFLSVFRLLPAWLLSQTSPEVPQYSNAWES